MERLKTKLNLCWFGPQSTGDDEMNYAPTARAETVRTVLTVACKKRYDIKHWDFDCAYLNADLSDIVYMPLPQGYEPEETGMVCKLKKSL